MTFPHSVPCRAHPALWPGRAASHHRPAGVGAHRTTRVARQPDAPPAAGQGVEGEQAVGRQLPAPAQVLDRLGRLQRADHAGDPADHAGFLAGGNLARRRRLREQAPLAGAAAGHDGHRLTEKTQDAGMRERAPPAHGGVVDEKLRRHAVGCVDDEVRRASSAAPLARQRPRAAARSAPSARSGAGSKLPIRLWRCRWRRRRAAPADADWRARPRRGRPASAPRLPPRPDARPPDIGRGGHPGSAPDVARRLRVWTISPQRDFQYRRGELPRAERAGAARPSPGSPTFPVLPHGDSCRSGAAESG